jgi:DNA-binding CsgD family transcriptional regulator
VTSQGGRGRCRERLERLAGSTLDRESIQREAIADLRRVIGFDRWCWPLADPRTLLPLGGLAEHDYGPNVPRVLELEYSGGDFAAMDVLARRSTPADSLVHETGGDLARSPRWDEVLRTVGINDEAVVACRDPFGCWGWIKAYRDRGDRPFDDDDLELLATAGSTLSSALRRGFTAAAPGNAHEPGPPGVIVLNPDLSVVSRPAGAHVWIEALPAAGLFAAWGILPAVVYPVATRARGGGAVAGTHALERGVDGRWLMIEAASLEGDGAAKIAVTLRAAAPAEIFDLLCLVYALTPRERDLVGALVAGLDTRAITERLVISRHTVQDHLKSVFQKVRVSSRRELLATFSASGDGCTAERRRPR